MQRHKILLDELRHLYTAITRARVNVWIYEENPAKRAPMFDFFIRRQLVGHRLSLHRWTRANECARQ